VIFVRVKTYLYTHKTSSFLRSEENSYLSQHIPWLLNTELNILINKWKNQMCSSVFQSISNITDKSTSIKSFICNAWDSEHSYWWSTKILKLHAFIQAYHCKLFVICYTSNLQKWCWMQFGAGGELYINNLKILEAPQKWLCLTLAGIINLMKIEITGLIFAETLNLTITIRKSCFCGALSPRTGKRGPSLGTIQRLCHRRTGTCQGTFSFYIHIYETLSNSLTLQLYF
jgi:hypothetical protein